MSGRKPFGSLFALSALAAVVVAAGSPYRVRPGETLSGIAARHDVTVAAVAEANHLADPDLILAGQRLVIPEAGSPQPEAFHIVQAGETLSAIAYRHGLTVGQLAERNGISDPGIIFTGTRLLLTTRQPAARSGGGRRIHLVQPGETLSGIAARYGTTVQAIVRANDLDDPNLIAAGAAISVPADGMGCPVPGASFFNDFGFARPGGRFHEGNDLFAPAGTPVLAVVSGRVEQLTGTIGGQQFWLHGDDGNTYVGTHLQDFGQKGRVSGGEVVGYVGDSGMARGSRPHLHFEVLPQGGESVNPYPLLVEACR